MSPVDRDIWTDPPGLGPEVVAAGRQTADAEQVLWAQFATACWGQRQLLGGLRGVTGTLGDTVILSDTGSFNELLQEITLKNSIAFTLELTTNFAGGVPDAFSFLILDSTGVSSLVDTNLLGGDALFLVGIDGSPTGAISVASSTSPGVPTTVTPVPEPGTLLLLLSGLPAVLRRVARRQR